MSKRLDYDEAVPETKEVYDAYAAIARFFDGYGLDYSRKMIFKTLRDALVAEPTKLHPGRLVEFLRALGKLVDSALCIHTNSSFRPAGKVILEENQFPALEVYKDYFGWEGRATMWRFIPRALSGKEYADPYKVFGKISRLGDSSRWGGIFDDLTDYCFFPQSFSEFNEEVNVLVLYRLLDKLVEAAHLVNVRAIDEVYGRKTPKWR
jgi:hypothetical protein